MNNQATNKQRSERKGVCGGAWLVAVLVSIVWPTTVSARAQGLAIDAVLPPIFIDVNAGAFDVVVNLDRSARAAIAADAAQRVAEAAAASPDRLVALRLSGAPRCAALLSDHQRAVLRRQLGTSEVRAAYDAAMSMMLDRVIADIRATSTETLFGIYGLPLESSGHGYRHVTDSNDRLSAALAECSAIISAHSVVAMGGETDPVSTVMDALSEALRLRADQPVVFRLNGVWSVLDEPGGESGMHRINNLPPLERTDLARRESRDDGWNGPYSGAHERPRVSAADDKVGLDGEIEEGPRPIYWAGKGLYDHEIDLTGTPIVRDRVVLFYANDLGLYPKYFEGRAVHGGIPQRANLAAHLNQARADVEAAIPDANWDGFAVIDYESWFPVWERAREEYQNDSIELVRAAHPLWSDQRIEEQARADYEAKAREFLEQTIVQCQTLRPNAKWGFWGYGRPWQQQYRQLDWIWEVSSAFYPSIYAIYSSVEDGAETLEDHQCYARDYRNQIRWSLEFINTFKGERPVLPFLWREYARGGGDRGIPNLNEDVNDLDLEIMLSEPWLYDIDGLLLWENCDEQGHVARFNRFLDDRMADVIAEFCRVD